MSDFDFSSLCTKSIGCRFHQHTLQRSETLPELGSGFDSICLLDSQGDDRAEQMICFLANHQPLFNLMRARSIGRVEILKELSPQNWSRGINHGNGAVISIRLRSGKNYLPFNQVMTTMIHHLAHITIPSHSDLFFHHERELQILYQRLSGREVKWYRPTNELLKYLIYYILSIIFIFLFVHLYRMTHPRLPVF
jgi:hypothetical protein